MNGRDIPVYLSPDNIALLQAALREAHQAAPAADREWLNVYLAEHLPEGDNQ